MKLRKRFNNYVSKLALAILERHPAKLHYEKCMLHQHQFIEMRKFGRTLLHLFRRSINLYTQTT